MGPEEQEFLTRLYWSNFKKLLSYVAHACRARGIAEECISDLSRDIVQDVFHTAVKKMNILFSHPKPDAWLMETCKRTLKAHMRQAAADNRCLLLLGALDWTVPDPVSGPAAAQKKMEYDDLLERIRRILSENEFHLFHMIVLRHTGYYRATQELNINLWACQKRMERIRKKLQRSISR